MGWRAALAFAMARLPLRIPFLLDGEVEIGAGSLVAGLALALAVALVGGLLPSLHAARMPVIRALR
jgi:ABC-type antimicrobial peptide transport system permease subunit